MAAPFTERLQEFLDRFLLGPEVAVKDRHVGNRPGTLLSHKLLDGWVPGRGVPHTYGPVFHRAVTMVAPYFGHGFSSAL